MHLVEHYGSTDRCPGCSMLDQSGRAPSGWIFHQGMMKRLKSSQRLVSHSRSETYHNTERSVLCAVFVSGLPAISHWKQVVPCSIDTHSDPPFRQSRLH